MTNLELVTKKIQEAVPSIMELKFGCEVESIFNKPGKRVLKIVDVDDVKVLTREVGSDLMENNNSQTWFLFKVDIKKILGRSITLEDCLIAIGKPEMEDSRKTGNSVQVSYNYILELQAT